jgi:hypothetical protein
MSVESNIDDVRLTDEYRAIIPQPVVITGITLDAFVSYLINRLGLVEISSSSIPE